MVKINIFQITPDRTKINVSVETAVGETIDSVKIWTEDTFKDGALAIDLASKLQGTNNKEVFTIDASELGLNLLNGIYFIEATSTNVTTPDPECTDCDNLSLLGVTANLSHYDECLLDRVLSVHYDVSDVDNNTSLNDIYNISMLIESICKSIKFGYYQNAIDVLSTLKVMCNENNDCSECSSLKDPVFKSGLSFGVISNNLVMK